MKRASLMIAALAALLGSFASPGAATPAVEQRVPVHVTSRGFEPASVSVRAGRPITLIVTRTTDRTCAKEFVIAERHVRRPLPLNQPVEIRLGAEKKGSLRFACGMAMVGGTLVVQ